MSLLAINIKGKVQEANSPVSDVDVVLSTNPPRQQKTDIKGEYQFLNVPVGTYTISIKVPSLYLSTSANPQSISIPRNARAHQEINFALESAKVIHGSVYHIVSGEPISEVAVILAFDNSSVCTYTNQHGQYRFDALKAGKYKVSIDVPSYAVAGSSTAKYLNFSQNAVEVQLSTETRQINFEIGENLPGSVMGYLIDPHSNISLSDVCVSIELNNKSIALSWTDEQGKYEFNNLIPLDYKLRVINLPYLINSPQMVLPYPSVVNSLDFKISYRPASLTEFYSDYFRSNRRSQGMSPLCYAIEQAYIDVAYTLISKENTNVNEVFKNSQGSSGRSSTLITPLSLCIENQQFLLINALIAAGADIEYQIGSSNSLHTPLEHAVILGFSEIVNHLLKLGARATDDALKTAAGIGKIKILNLLLDFGANPHVRSTDGTSLLGMLNHHYYPGIQNNEDEAILLIKRLVEMEVDPNQVNIQGRSPLHLALIYKKPRIFKHLIELGANIDLFPDLLFHALKYDQYPIFCFLLAKGASPNILCEGISPLSLAVSNQRIEYMKQLKERGADPNFKDANGDTPVFKAVLSSDLNVLRTLLEFQPNLWVQNKEGLTPMDLAIKKSAWGAYELLIQEVAKR